MKANIESKKYYFQVFVFLFICIFPVYVNGHEYKYYDSGSARICMKFDDQGDFLGRTSLENCAKEVEELGQKLKEASRHYVNEKERLELSLQVRLKEDTLKTIGEEGVLFRTEMKKYLAAVQKSEAPIDENRQKLARSVTALKNHNLAAKKINDELNVVKNKLDESLAPYKNEMKRLASLYKEHVAGKPYLDFIKDYFIVQSMPEGESDVEQALRKAELIFLGHSHIDQGMTFLIQEIIRHFSSPGDAVFVEGDEKFHPVQWNRYSSLDPLRKEFETFFTKELDNKLSILGWDHVKEYQNEFNVAELGATISAQDGFINLTSNEEENLSNQLENLYKKINHSLDGVKDDVRSNSLVECFLHSKDPGYMNGWYDRLRVSTLFFMAGTLHYQTEVFKKGLSQVEEMGKKYVVLIPKKTSNRITTKSYYQNMNLY